MRKKILVLTGSPRENGNSEMLADAFIKGAEEAGHITTKFNAGRKKIKGCTVCNACYSKGTACVNPDDFNELAPIFEDADVIAIVTPLYWFTYPAQLKAAIDKIYAFLVGGRMVAVKESILIVCGDSEDAEMFDGIIKAYQITAGYLNWKNRGVLIVPAVSEKGDILKTNQLQKAEKMGREV